jgi:hypothetical protein
MHPKAAGLWSLPTLPSDLEAAQEAWQATAKDNSATLLENAQLRLADGVLEVERVLADALVAVERSVEGELAQVQARLERSLAQSNASLALALAQVDQRAGL